ncbi:MAG: threonine/serine exporter family protein [Brevibacterium sp.]|nr:threonine/serine exporter family protein [Brevibacterium sp.]MDN5876276.1 threonine/serine exporter family protein [Brevibacterium sp.]MDN6133054.1 threonine/serine exporter family protein [Brevibacterium sp.]MDN6158607.1 threonine/serine exporter family protein [Brevibacterium sp.]MDN6176239.1 threonine/serine exporter family protein [Brevibacterium sp.]
MTDDSTEEAPTAEVPVDAQSSSGPEHGAKQAETGSSALQEMLELTRQQRLQELREAPTGQLKSDETGSDGAKSPTTSTAKSKPKADHRGASQRIAQRVARRTVGRLVTGTSVNTQPVPIVTALKGSPYKAPVQASEPGEDEARMVLDFAADLAAIMMRAGAGTTDIEVSVIAACAAFGLTTAQVDLTSNTLTVHYSTSDGRLMTVMRVNRGESIHFAKLGSVHKLVTELVAGNIEFNDARNRLDAIRSQRRPYQEWTVTGAWGLMVGSLVLLLGGGAVAAGLGILMSIFIQQSGKLIGRTSLPSFFITALQAAIATLVAMVAGNFGIIESPQYLVAAGIVLLLPTQSLYSSVQDALTNFPLTAAGRMVGVVLTLAGIVSGLALGVVTGEAIGLSPIEVLVPKTGVHVLTAIVSLVAATVVAMAGVVGMQSTRRFILPAAFVGLASYITMTALTLLAIDNVLASLLASTVTGFLARPLSLRLGAPSIVLMIPAIYTLLQGLSIFTAVYQIAAESATTSFAVGLSSLFSAILANAALAVGAVLGSYLARPLKNLKADAVERTAKSARSAESSITIDGSQQRD